MPLADYTAISNLALDHLGEPYLTAYETDTTVAAQAARLHLPQCVETVLEGHVWSFATRCSQLTTAPVTVTTASLTIDPGGADNQMQFTAVAAGPGGNEISVEIMDSSGDEISVGVVGNAITATPYLRNNGERATATLDYSGVTPGTTTLTINGREYTFVSYFTSADYENDVVGGSALFPPYYTVENLINHINTAPNGGTPNANVTVARHSSVSTRLVFTARTAGTVGNEITIEQNSFGTLSGETFEGGTDNFEYCTADEVVEAINATAAASALVTAANADGSDGSGTVAAVAETNLSGGSSTSSVYAPAYGSAFNLPGDCLRVIKLDSGDNDIPRNRWEIQGRYILLEEEQAEAPVIHYITKDPPVDEWPTTFTDAVAFLLASRLAPKLAQDQGVAAEFLQKHEQALGKARSKDSRETRSKENHGPRHLAARSGLVRARYGKSHPPY